MESVLNLFNSGFGAFMSVSYFKALSGKPRIEKDSVWKIYIVLVLAFSLVFIIEKYGIKLLAGSIIIFTLSHLYEVSSGSRLFFTGIFVTICSLAAAFSVTVVHLMSEVGLPLITEYSDALTFVVFCTYIFIFVEFVKLKEIKAKTFNSINSTLSILSFIPILLILFLQLLISHIYDFGEQIGEVESLVILVILAIFMLYNVLMLVVIDYKTAFDVEKDVKDEAYRNLESQRKHYRELLDQHRHSHKEVHDLKNKIQVVILAIKLNKRDFALSKLEELAGDTFSTESFVKTGNAVVDAIFRSKKSKLNDNEIELNVLANVSDDINMNDFDLAVIIGNAIDNAVEACLKLPASERYIEVEIEEENNQLSFIFTNPTSENLVVVGNVVQTSKNEDKHLHGFGLENMRKIARKYNGNSTVNCEGGFFELKLNLQIPHK